MRNVTVDRAVAPVSMGRKQEASWWALPWLHPGFSLWKVILEYI